MAQRLVLKSEGGEVKISDIIAFAKAAERYGVQGLIAKMDYTAKGKTLVMSVPVPKNVRVVGARVIRIKPKTKKGRQVEKQIDDHKRKKKSGEGEGYVPPVGRKTAPNTKKIKCPDCDTRKPIVRIAGVQSIKPHVSKGDPCPGGGKQVARGKVVG